MTSHLGATITHCLKIAKRVVTQSESRTNANLFEIKIYRYAFLSCVITSVFFVVVFLLRYSTFFISVSTPFAMRHYVF